MSARQSFVIQLWYLDPLLQRLSDAQVTIVNAVSAPLPFLPADAETRVSEEVRLRHRILDLRCALGPHPSSQPPSVSRQR